MIGVDLMLQITFILVKKTEYDEVMKNGKDKRLKELYTRIRNGWDNFKGFNIFYEETLNRVYALEFMKFFDSIFVVNTQQNHNEKQIPEKEQTKTHIRLCEVCRQRIENDEEIMEENNQHYHPSCHYFACCWICRSKEDLHCLNQPFRFCCKDHFIEKKKKPLGNCAPNEEYRIMTIDEMINEKREMKRIIDEINQERREGIFKIEDEDNE